MHKLYTPAAFRMAQTRSGTGCCNCCSVSRDCLVVRSSGQASSVSSPALAPAFAPSPAAPRHMSTCGTLFKNKDKRGCKTTLNRTSSAPKGALRPAVCPAALAACCHRRWTHPGIDLSMKHARRQRDLTTQGEPPPMPSSNRPASAALDLALGHIGAQSLNLVNGSIQQPAQIHTVDKTGHRRTV